jgi:hypothetical protein
MKQKLKEQKPIRSVEEIKDEVIKELERRQKTGLLKSYKHFKEIEQTLEDLETYPEI